MTDHTRFLSLDSSISWYPNQESDRINPIRGLPSSSLRIRRFLQLYGSPKVQRESTSSYRLCKTVVYFWCFSKDCRIQLSHAFSLLSLLVGQWWSQSSVFRMPFSTAWCLWLSSKRRLKKHICRDYFEKKKQKVICILSLGGSPHFSASKNFRTWFTATVQLFGVSWRLCLWGKK